jgi:adenine-specific DNA-methyltransferase
MDCSNTSGTLNSFHNGWGGDGNSDLNDKSLKEIEMKKLAFIDGEIGGIYREYAEKVFDKNDLGEMDIVFADPPYSALQYSSNYNHLNSIVKNDKYNPGEVVRGKRSGIRDDYNKSNFCKKVKVDKESEIRIVEKAFLDFIESINTKYVVMSYSNEGLLEIDKLVKIMWNNGENKIEVIFKEHKRYTAGKSTKTEETNNKVKEYLIIIKKNIKQGIKELKKIIELLK